MCKGGVECVRVERNVLRQRGDGSLFIQTPTQLFSYNSHAYTQQKTSFCGNSQAREHSVAFSYTELTNTTQQQTTKIRTGFQRYRLQTTKLFPPGNNRPNFTPPSQHRTLHPFLLKGQFALLECCLLNMAMHSTVQARDLELMIRRSFSQVMNFECYLHELFIQVANQ